MKGNLNIDNRSGVFHQDDKTARTENYNCVRKGSLTVETACVMPLILLTLIGLIYLSFFVHNRAGLQLRHMSQQSVEVWKVLKRMDRYITLQECEAKNWGV